MYVVLPTPQNDLLWRQNVGGIYPPRKRKSVKSIKSRVAPFFFCRISVSGRPTNLMELRERQLLRRRNGPTGAGINKNDGREITRLYLGSHPTD